MRRIKITTFAGGCVDFAVADDFVFQAFTMLVRDRGYFEHFGTDGGIYVPYSAITSIVMETDGRKMEGYRFPDGMVQQ